MSKKFQYWMAFIYRGSFDLFEMFTLRLSSESVPKNRGFSNSYYTYKLRMLAFRTFAKLERLLLNLEAISEEVVID